MSKEILRPRKKIILPFDPVIQPWSPASENLSPVPGSLLTPDLFLKAFDHRFVWQAESLLHDWNDAKFIENQAYIDAAVLLPLVYVNGEIHVILTRRSSRLKKHAGQISFPGGRVEESDPSAQEAALRETEEEIGIPASSIEVVGQLPDLFTGTGFLMKPYVGWVDEGFSIRTDSNEVEEVFYVPLSFLMDPRNHRLHNAKLPDGTVRNYFSMPWNSYFIWGATASVIRNLYHRLRQAAI
ncbi:CoA pyrophosphatase [Advenella sp. RU8]|uniref:CoA pyrophosphatase n=1 Tax=Advenella sp. RU8 TaxID=3399575 RepID=UPI003AAAE91A